MSGIETTPSGEWRTYSVLVDEFAPTTRTGRPESLLRAAAGPAVKLRVGAMQSMAIAA